MAASGNATSILGVRITGTTGNTSSNLVYSTSPTLTTPTLTSPILVTPTLGVATATSINKLTLTAPATSATLTIANGKTLTASNTVTFAGTDGSTVNFGTGGVVLYSGLTSLSALTSAPSLTTVGTITAGVWQGTDIALANIAQGTARSVLGVAGNGTADYAPIQGTANQVLRITTAGTGLGFGSIELGQSATVGTSILLLANGGTGFSTYSSGDIIYASALNTLAKRTIGTTGQVLTVVAGLPTWSTPGSGGTVTSVSGGSTGFSFTASPAPTMSGTLDADNGGTGQSVYAVGDILYASTTTALSKLADVAIGNALISGGVGVAPSWGKIGLTTHVTGDLPLANLAQGTARSVLAVAGNTTADYAPVQGTANQVLRIDSGGVALGFGALNVASTAAVTGALPYTNGGTGLTAAQSGNIMIGNGTGWTSTVPTGNNGISISSGAGSMAINYAFNSTRQTLTDASTIVWTVSAGEAAVVTLGNINRTLSIVGPVAGRTYVVQVIQGSGGSKTITTYPTGTNWGTAGAPTLATVAGVSDLLTFHYTGSAYLAVHSGQF